MTSKKPASVSIVPFFSTEPVRIQLDKLGVLLDMRDDEGALSLLDSIPPVERAWAYRELGA
jgi:hypothetical protein